MSPAGWGPPRKMGNLIGRGHWDPDSDGGKSPKITERRWPSASHRERPHFDFGLRACRMVRKSVSVVGTTKSVIPCSGSPGKQRHRFYETLHTWSRAPPRVSVFAYTRSIRRLSHTLFCAFLGFVPSCAGILLLPCLPSSLHSSRPNCQTRLFLRVWSPC